MWTVVFHIKDNFYSALVIVADISLISAPPDRLHTHTRTADRVCEGCDMMVQEQNRHILLLLLEIYRLVNHDLA